MIVRRIGAVVAGTIAANIAIFGWEALLRLMPFGGASAAGALIDAGTVEGLPLAAQGWIVAGWGFGTFIGAMLAWRIDHGHWTGWIVAALVAAAGVANVVMIPHPFWMRVAAVAVPFVGALFAYGASRRWHAARLHLRR